MRKSFTGRLKASARIILDGKHGVFAMTTFLVGLCNFILTYILSSVFGGSGMFNFILRLACSALMNVILYLLFVGQQRMYLNLCRDEMYGFGDLFSSFTGHPEQIALYSLLQFVLQSFVYNSTIYILLSALSLDLATILLVIVGLIAELLIFAWVQIALGFVLCLFVDQPYITAKEAVKESYSMMNGNKGKMLRIYISFIGMELLALLSFGIGSLLVDPYRNTTLTLFYMEVCGEDTQQTYSEQM